MKRGDEKELIEKETDLSRRKFLLGGAGVLIGGAIAGGIGSSILTPRSAQAAPLGYLPTPSSLGKTIDLNAVKALAFSHYPLSGG